MNGRIQIKEIFEQSDYENFIVYVRENTEILKSLLQESNFNELEKKLENEKIQLAYYIKKEYLEKNIHFIFGRYIGILDMLYEHLVEQSSQFLLEKDIESYDISEIPHVNDIIYSLQKDEGIRHGKLAEKVGIEKSTLTGIMEKLVNKGAVKYSRPGKYKYYYLTDLGRKYFEKNKNLIETGMDIDALIEQLFMCLSKENNATELVVKIITALCNGNSKFAGYNPKSKSNVDAEMIFATIPSIKPINVMFLDQKTKVRVNQAMTCYLENEEDPIVTLIDNRSNIFSENSQTRRFNYISI